MKALLLLLLLGLVCYGLYQLSLVDPAVSAQPALFAPQVQDTPRPGVFGLLVGALDAQSTASAARAQAYAADQTANQLYAASTVEANEAARQERAAQAQRTAIAADATAEAGSTVTAQAWAMVGWTATADAAESTAQAHYTAAAALWTQTAIAQNISSTQVAAAYLANTLRRAEIREEATNAVIAWLPYGLTLLAAIAVVMFGTVAGIKFWRSPVVIPRDARGDIGAMVNNNGSIVDLDRVFGGVLQLGQAGVASPQFVPQDVQERHDARDQAVDLATRGLPGQVPLPQRQPSRPAARMPGAPNYRIYIAPEQPPQLLEDPSLAQVLEAQWKEVK